MDSRPLYVERQQARRGWRAVRSFLLLLGLVQLMNQACSEPAVNSVADSAASAALVERVQWPAWIESAAGRSALSAGQVVKPDDRLLTGDGARLVIRLADGSTVKLGERAELRVAILQARKDGVLNAGLEVARGAFRFTTGLVSKLLGKREVSVRFPTLTIGVRGTDFWGSSDQDRELVLLLEGVVSLTRHPAPDSAEVLEERRLTVPNTYLLSAQRQPFEERSATPAEVEAWALETEPVASRPTGAARGGFKATIAGALTASRAATIAASLHKAGYPARVAVFPAAPADAGGAGRKRYQVMVGGLDSRDSAARLRTSLRALLVDKKLLPQGGVPAGQ